MRRSRKTVKFSLVFQANSSCFDWNKYCCQLEMVRTAQHRPNKPRRSRRAIYSSLMTDKGSLWTGLSINILSRYSSMTSQSKRDFISSFPLLFESMKRLKLNDSKVIYFLVESLFRKLESVIGTGNYQTQTVLQTNYDHRISKASTFPPCYINNNFFLRISLITRKIICWHFD